MVFFIDYSLIFIFLFFALALGYHAIQFLQGIVAVIATIIFIAEVIATICFLIRKINYRKCYRNIPASDIVMTAVSSALCLFCSYLFLHDISNYGTDLGSIISFIVAFLVIGAPWLGTVAYWLEATNGEGRFCYEAFTKELLTSGVIIFIFFIL